MDATQQKVISLLKGLSTHFPSMSFVYGFDAAARQHLVNVEPTGLYKSEAYMLAEADVYDAWDAVFPTEDLVFVSNNVHHPVLHPLYIVLGKIDIRLRKSAKLISEPMLVSNGMPTPTMQATELYGCLEVNRFKVTLGRPAIAQPTVPYDGRQNELGANEYNYAMAA